MTFLLYLAVCFAASASPGPAVLLAIKNGARYGLKNALAGCLGNICAMLTMACLATTGLSAILLASATLFILVKLIGGLYLIYLGSKLWRQSANSKNEKTSTQQASPGFSALFREAYLVGISNPKAIVFYTALFPQFIDLQRAALPQFLVLAVSFAIVSFACLTSYAAAANRISEHLNKPHIARWFHRITGGVFIGFGIALLR